MILPDEESHMMDRGVIFCSVISLFHPCKRFLCIVLLNRKTIVIFYTEILALKVVLWCFFMSETSAKIQNSSFQVKIQDMTPTFP